MQRYRLPLAYGFGAPASRFRFTTFPSRLIQTGGMSKALAKSRSSLVAKALAGSWRSHPPPLEISDTELDQIIPLLLGSGAAALGWWRILHSELDQHSGSAIELQQAYRLLALQDTLHEREIKKIFALLRSAGVEPLLVKGWAIARLYPETVLRPFGDVDICVRPEHFKLASERLKSSGGEGLWADLHAGFSELEDRSIEDLYARSQLVKIDDAAIRVLGAEDHLGLLAIHLLKHGAWRPLWLCDIGAVIESLPEEFDWDLCLGHNQRRASWITSAIGLAHHLLGARIDGLPVAERARRLPNWLVPNVLKEWETPFAINQPPMKHSEPMSKYLRHPMGILKGLRNRWPNPIIATISLRGSFNNLPRWPYQLGNCLSRTTRFFTQLACLMREL